jgi:hypothetical protein
MATESMYVENSQQSHACRLWKGSHILAKCKEFKVSSVITKRQFVRRNRLCVKYFASNHLADKCKYAVCSICKGTHHVWLHKEANSEASDSETPPKEDAKNAVTRHTSMKIRAGLGLNVLLTTAIVNVKSIDAKMFPATVILDSASQLSFITSAVVKKLGLRANKCSLTVVGINNKAATLVAFTCDVDVVFMLSGSHVKVHCAVIKSITSNMPTQNVDFSSWNVSSDIILAHPRFNEPSAVDMLLGADVFFGIFLNDRQCRDRCPTLINTHFGWVFSGKFSHSSLKGRDSPRMVNLLKWEDLEENLQRFCEIEELPICSMSREERLCEEHLEHHTSRDKNGHFVIRHPVRLNAEDLGESRQNADKRLKCMERDSPRIQA